MTASARRLLAAAALAVAAGTAAPASADPLCVPVGKSPEITVCGPGMVCDELCHWHNPDVRCTYDGTSAAVTKACDTVDRL